jgi:very-short-patch-repair endonuclease
MYDFRASADSTLVEIANRQHGIVTIGQLREVGLDKHRVLHRTRTGRLHHVHRGVYAVGHSRLSTEARWMAAILACGQKAPLGITRRDGDVHGGGAGRGEHNTRTVLDAWGAALSHRSAAVHWGLLPPADGPVDVAVPGSGGRKKRRGIRLHRSSSLLSAAVTLRAGIPVTSPARTIADLRRSAGLSGKRRLVSHGELRRATRQADVLGLPIDLPSKGDRTRSDLERDFLQLCRRHRLAAPEVNVPIGRHLVDFLWRETRLVVETDGYRYHRGETAFQDDHGRDFELRTRGYEVLRLSERQVEMEPARIAAWLRARLQDQAAPRADL